MSALNLLDEHAQFGKLGNNVEIHGDESVPGHFSIPVTLMLVEQRLDGLMGKYFWRSLFNVDAATGLASPVGGFRRCKPLQLEDVYEDVTVIIGERAGADIVRREEFRGGRFSKVFLEAQSAGMTQLQGQVYVHAGLGDRNTWLQKLQNHEVYLEILDGRIAAKKNPAQGDLPLQQPADTQSAAPEASTDQDQGDGEPQAANESDREFVTDADETPAEGLGEGAEQDYRQRAPEHIERGLDLATGADLDALSGLAQRPTNEAGELMIDEEFRAHIRHLRAFGSKADLELRCESVTEEQDAELDRQIGRPPKFESAGGEAANARTHRDLPAGDETAAFEEGLRQELQTFETLPSGVIDGRSERVKHQDEQRARNEGEAA